MTALVLDPLTLAYHELRSPLGLVATAARALSEDNHDDALRGRCEVIVRSVERMLRTTRHVLDLARSEKVSAADRYSPADLAYQIAGDLGGFDVRVEVSASDEALDWECYGAPGVYEALVQSLLSNAIDHSDPGVVVTVRLEANAEWLTIDVANPIAVERRHNGLGAGPYLSTRLAEQLGGALAATVEDGFYRASIRLPR